MLALARSPVEPQAGREYTSIGLRSFGKGLFHYEPATGDRLRKLRFFAVEPGRLVISNIKGWEGAVAVTRSMDADCIASNRFLQLIPRADKIDVGWAKWFFLSRPGNTLLQRASPGSADRNRTLSIERFESLEIPLPPIDEQRRVAAKLDRAGEMVEHLRALTSKSNDLAAALPGSMVARAQKNGSLKSTRLGDILEQVQRPIEVAPSTTYVTIGIRSFGKGIFHYDARPGAQIGKLRFFQVEPGLLAISNIKGWEGAVALTSSNDLGTIASNRFLFFRARDGLADVRYMSRYLMSGPGLEALGRASPGSADRNRTLAVHRFEDLKLMLPNGRTQTEIGAELTRLNGALDRRSVFTMRAKARAAALTPSILNQAFGGMK